MTLFAFDEALDVPLRNRVRDAQAELEAMVKQGRSWVVPDVGERARAFARGTEHMPLIVSEQELLHRDIEAKHGPFIEYLAERDLRPQQQHISVPTILPHTTFEPTRTTIPTQLVGFRTGLEGLQRYEAFWTDVFAAWNAYQQLREQKPKIKHQSDGRVVVEYASGITLTAHGLRKRTPGSITATVVGIPAEGTDRPSHSPHYRLEAVSRSIPAGEFHVDSGYAQHRGRNMTLYLYRRDVQRGTATITKHPLSVEKQKHRDTPKMPRALVDRVALYKGDILGLYLIAGVARRQYDVEINQPFPFEPNAQLMKIAQRIGENTIIIDYRKNRLRPNKTQWNRLYSLAVSKDVTPSR